MIMGSLLSILTFAAALFMGPDASATIPFLEDFATGSDTVVNDWNTGDNGWIVTEPNHPNRATSDGSAGSGRIFARSDFGSTTVSLLQDLGGDALSTGTVSWDYLDGTGSSDLRFVLSDNLGTVALKLFYNSGGGGADIDLQMFASGAPNGGDFVTPADSVQVRIGHNATITVDFDVNTDMVTVNAVSTDGDFAAATFPFLNPVDEIRFVDWRVVPTPNNPGLGQAGSELNVTFMSIVPEPGTLALLCIGGLALLLRCRRTD
jgi:hypothetical protein